MAEYQRCLNCGQPVNPDDRFCANCGQPLERGVREEPPPTSPPPPETPVPLASGSVPPSPPEEGPQYVPWEDRQKLGFFKALWETWKESTFYPNAFFARAPHAGGIWNPLFYAVIIAWVGYAINQIVGLMFSSLTLGYLANFIQNEELFESFRLYGGLGFIKVVFILIMLPFVIAATAFIASGIYHLILMIFGWSRRDYEATFRAVAYGAGPLIFMIVPVCGSPIAYIWSLVLTIIGIKHLQKTTSGQASLTVLLPLILCCCFISFMAAIFGAAIIGLIQNAMNGGYYFD